LAEQLDLALSELALRRAAYRQARDDEGMASPWLTTELDRLAVPRVARALAAELAALERLRLWAQELHALHIEARARGLMPPTTPPPSGRPHSSSAPAVPPPAAAGRSLPPGTVS
nr:hypothetical protein [Micromonospora sp. DSM 115978]